MKLWTWDMLLLEFLDRPQEHHTYSDLPSSYVTFEEWLAVDAQKTDIVARVIGCKCPESLKQQQHEAMEYRRTVCSTAVEWIGRFSGDPGYSAAPIRRITQHFLRQKQCHRNWEGKWAGVRCYCDTHNH